MTAKDGTVSRLTSNSQQSLQDLIVASFRFGMLCFGTIVLTSGQQQVSSAFHERVVSTTRVVQKLLRVESQRSLRLDRKLSTELPCAFVLSVAIMHGLRAPRQFHDKVHRNSRAYRLVGQPIFSKTSLTSCACVIGACTKYCYDWVWTKSGDLTCCWYKRSPLRRF